MSGFTIEQHIANRSRIAAETPQWLDPSHIAFVSDLSGTPDVWCIPAAVGFPQRLTTGLGEVPFMSSRIVRLSPDQRQLAYVANAGPALEIFLSPTDGGPARQLTHAGGAISGLSWAPDSVSLVFSGNRRGTFDIYQVAVADGRTTRLTHSTLYEVCPVFSPDGQQVLFVRMDERWAEHELVAIPAGASAPASRTPTNSTEHAAAPTPEMHTPARPVGQVGLPAGGSEPAGGTASAKSSPSANAPTGAERVILHDIDMFDYHMGQTFGYPLVSPDGQSVLFRSYRSGYFNYWLVPIGGGAPRPLAPEETDQTDAAWSPDGRHVVYGSNHNGTLGLCLAALDGSAPRRLVTPQIGVCSLPQFSPDGAHVAYLFQTPTAPLDLFVVSVADGSVRQLTTSALSGSAQRLLTPQKVTYQSFDGLHINAYLYKPASIPDRQKLPCIVWIHGGPSDQWSDKYYSEMQYFAQAGYVVLAPNIRGSTGYGRAFEDLNNADWGYADLKDAIAGVDYLKTLPHVDPARMGIAGTSYGGYLAAAAVCFTQNVFQAAVSASGYPDRVAMYHEQETRHIKQMEFKFGPFETHAHIYAKCSPAKWAKDATTPCFVLHGEGFLPRSDGAKNFALALEKEYKTVRYKAYPGEGYYVQSPANTRQMWLDMREFFEMYL